MGTSYYLFVSIIALSLAFIMKSHIRNIADMTTCFGRLEAGHNEICDQASAEEPKNIECLGWTLVSRKLPSGCYFKIKPI